VRISETEETVTIDGVESDALKFAFEMQMNYPESIRIIDMNYSFDVDVSRFTTEEDFIEEVQSLQKPKRRSE